MIILVIPDVHLKPWMFDRADALLQLGVAEKAVCLMDIPDEWDQQLNLDLYINTFDEAIRFQKKYPDTLWCYGNHDLSYLWGQPESGFSYAMLPTVIEKIGALQRALPDEAQMQYLHRIDNVLFLHGGLTEAFVRSHAADLEYRDTDGIVRRINSLGFKEIWDDSSPIWYRPQGGTDKMYRSEDMIQVVGHTPVEGIHMENNVISCDVFSTFPSMDFIGSREFLLINTATKEYMGIR